MFEKKLSYFCLNLRIFANLESYDFFVYFIFLHFFKLRKVVNADERVELFQVFSRDPARIETVAKVLKLALNSPAETEFHLVSRVAQFCVKNFSRFFTHFNRKQIFNLFQVCRILWAINCKLLVFPEKLPARRNKNVFSVPG